MAQVKNTLEQRIKTAIADCESWRRTGLVEKYLESFDLVEALQAELALRENAASLNVTAQKLS